MKNKIIYPGLRINIAIGAVLLTSGCIPLFLNSKLVDIHRGTSEGGLIAGVGVLIIIVVISAISITATLLLNRYQKKIEK